MIAGLSKKEVQSKWSARAMLVSGILFVLGLILTPILVGIPLLILGGIGVFASFFVSIFCPIKKINSYICPNCETEIFIFRDKKEMVLNCPVCKKRLLFKENKLVLV